MKAKLMLGLILKQLSDEFGKDESVKQMIDKVSQQVKRLAQETQKGGAEGYVVEQAS